MDPSPWNCAACGRQWPVPSLARECEAGHEQEDRVNDTSCVREFMQATQPEQVGVQLGDGLGSERLRLLRARLVLSEALELAQALGVVVVARHGDVQIVTDDDLLLEADTTAYPDLVGVADACADLRYVVVGTEVTFDIPGDAVFAEVHRSNMTKLLSDGTALLDAGGKVLKPDTYSPANVASVLDRYAKSYLESP